MPTSNTANASPAGFQPSEKQSPNHKISKQLIPKVNAAHSLPVSTQASANNLWFVRQINNLPSSPAPTGDADRKHSYPATANHAPPPPPGAGTGRCRAPTTRQNPAPPSTTNQPASLRTGCGSAWAAGCNADTHGHPAANVRIILDAIPQNCYSFRRSLLCKVKGKKHTMQMRLTGI